MIDALTTEIYYQTATNRNTHLNTNSKVLSSTATLCTAVIAVAQTVTYKIMKFIFTVCHTYFGWDVTSRPRVYRLSGAGMLNWILSLKGGCPLVLTFQTRWLQSKLESPPSKSNHAVISAHAHRKPRFRSEAWCIVGRKTDARADQPDQQLKQNRKWRQEKIKSVCVIVFGKWGIQIDIALFGIFFFFSLSLSSFLFS